jgi:hypothetical protein
VANIEKALKILYEVEFNNLPHKFLHKNKTENKLTLGGVYQKANPYSIDWILCEDILKVCSDDIKRASNMLYYDEFLQEQVKNVFKKSYWDKMRLNEINSQLIANEMFLFGVVAGWKNGGKLAQRIAKVIDDGIIGSISIQAINNISDKYFSEAYDKLEIKYFEDLVKNNDSLKIYLAGWKNRALRV